MTTRPSDFDPNQLEPPARPAPARPDQNSSAVPLATHLTLGQLGEALVGEWIEAQGGKILHQRWHCRRGELDLVALLPETPPQITLPRAIWSPSSPSVLAFIEVKTRSQGNWDEGGLLSITPSKQQKIWHSAHLYLAEYPRFSRFPCRCDVALVSSRQLKQKTTRPETVQLKTVQLKTVQSKTVPDYQPQSENLQHPPTLGQPIQRGGYQLTLRHYLADAFRLD